MHLRSFETIEIRSRVATKSPCINPASASRRDLGEISGSAVAKTRPFERAASGHTSPLFGCAETSQAALTTRQPAKQLFENAPDLGRMY